VGRTTDVDGKDGFALTLQAREQHIRRDKAKSNICTNQGLMVTAATIYMAMMGDTGLEQVAAQSHQSLHQLLALLKPLAIEPAFSAPVFHEVALRLPISAVTVIDRLAEQDIVAGYALSRDLEDADNLLLVCVTETKTEEDLQQFAQALSAACR
jgi:glycine dehydrogenase subunit 1